MRDLGPCRPGPSEALTDSASSPQRHAKSVRAAAGTRVLVSTTRKKSFVASQLELLSNNGQRKQEETVEKIPSEDWLKGLVPSTTEFSLSWGKRILTDVRSETMSLLSEHQDFLPKRIRNGGGGI